MNKNTYDNLRAVGSFPGKLYGLPKIRKASVPVLSAIKCHNFKLAKFLVPLLTSQASTDFTISDVFTFAAEIQKRRDLNNTFMVGLDKVSLLMFLALKPSTLS